MVRNIEQIEREMVALEGAVVKIAQEFHHAYSQYLTTLGQAIRQQLIVASYHLCTHGYPEQFLKFPLSQRQELQQAIRQLAKEAQTQTSEPLQPIVPMMLMPSRPFFGVEEDEEGFDETTSLEDLLEADPTEEPEQEAPLAELANINAETADLASTVLSPKDVLNWQETLEDSLMISLQTLSHAANRILQRSGLLPKQLPEPVLEVASKAELSSETPASPPNLLSLLIETESPESKESTMTQIMAIRLRLSEIEYADVNLSVSRSKIRELSARLSKLGRDYYRVRRELSIAQAEAAWRASWYED